MQGNSNFFIGKFVTEELFVDEKHIDEIHLFKKKSLSFLCNSSMMQYYTKIEIQPIHNVVRISEIPFV